MYFFLCGEEEDFFSLWHFGLGIRIQKKKYRIGSDPNPQKIKSDPQLCWE
jgi:hypothetical protein